MAEEARVTAEAFGCRVDSLTDVGVAGAHRLFAEAARLQAADVLVVVAGMEGALPSLVAGMVAAPAVIAVPTSVGYAAFDGLAALLAMLNSCAVGVSVVNIDNGFGAGALAARILRRGPGAAHDLRLLRLLRRRGGDMVLGALLDAGGSAEALRAGLAGVPVDPFELEVTGVERGGIGATQVKVRAERSHVIRTWAYLRGALGEADLPAPVRDRSLAIFGRLAEAEARIHRKPVDQVHFHEVGAVDAVVDIVGSAVLLHDLGVAEVWASPVATGTGLVRTEHGMLPVPAPAVLELLGEVPIYSGGVTAELTTPTGAAILAASASRFTDLPPMRVAATGYGAGTRQHDELPNLLRVLVGERTEDGAAGDGGLVLEANLDDMTPELAPGCWSGCSRPGRPTSGSP